MSYQEELEKLFESIKVQWQTEFNCPMTGELVFQVLEEEILQRQKAFLSQRLFHMKPTKKLIEAKKVYLEKENENKPRGGGTLAKPNFSK